MVIFHEMIKIIIQCFRIDYGGGEASLLYTFYDYITPVFRLKFKKKLLHLKSLNDRLHFWNYENTTKFVNDMHLSRYRACCLDIGQDLSYT